MTGYPYRLDALHGGRPVPSPEGIVLASPRTVADCGLPAAPDQPFARFGLAVARVGPDDGSRIPADFAAGLLRLHRHVLRETLAHALRHLHARTSGGTSLLAKQQVRARLAEAAMDLEEAAALETVALETVTLETMALETVALETMALETMALETMARPWPAARRLIVAGHLLLQALGASGFLADGAGADVYLTEVCARVYLGGGR